MVELMLIKILLLNFKMWISPKFKLLLIKEFERLKQEEQKQLGWSAKREFSKINYKIHTEAMFGMTAKLKDMKD